MTTIKAHFFLGIILSIFAGALFFWLDGQILNSKRNDNINYTGIVAHTNTTFDPVNNINTTDQRERGPAVIPSGKQVSYDTSFSKPNTTDFREYCLNDSTCFHYPTSFFACPSSLDEETAYLMEGVTQCEGLNDAPAFVVQRFPLDGQTAVIPPAYISLFTSESFIQDQVTSDEIYGQKNGRTISCYDAKYDRVCKVSLADGTAYSLDGRWYNQTDATAERSNMVHTTFDAIVRSMMGE